MAAIEKLQVRYPVSTFFPTAIGTYYADSTYITNAIGGYTPVTDNRYKFIVTGTATAGPGESLNCAVYKTQLFVGNVLIPTPFEQFGDVIGSYTNIIDGINLYVGVPSGQAVNATDDFLVVYDHYEDVPTLATISAGDLFDTSGTQNIYKVVYRDGTGDHVVYQEQLPTPASPTYITKTSSTITWRYYVPSTAQENVRIYARLNSIHTAYILIGDNVAPGSYVNKTWSGLTGGTSYYSSFYLVPYTYTGLKDSAIRVGGSITTLSSGATFWAYDYTANSDPNADIYYEGTATTVAEAHDEIDLNYPPQNYSIGTIAAYYVHGSSPDIFYVFVAS